MKKTDPVGLGALAILVALIGGGTYWWHEAGRQSQEFKTSTEIRNFVLAGVPYRIPQNYLETPSAGWELSEEKRKQLRVVGSIYLEAVFPQMHGKTRDFLAYFSYAHVPSSNVMRIILTAGPGITQQNEFDALKSVLGIVQNYVRAPKQDASGMIRWGSKHPNTPDYYSLDQEFNNYFLRCGSRNMPSPSCTVTFFSGQRNRVQVVFRQMHKSESTRVYSSVKQLVDSFEGARNAR